MPENKKVNPCSMSKEELVNLFLTLLPQRTQFNLELLEQDLKSGAPQNEDETINMFHYAAWLYGRKYSNGK